MNAVTKTYVPKADEIKRQWRVIDAAGKNLGHVASEAAAILRGKDKPSFTPYLDTGDFVIIVNAAKIRVSADKTETKIYWRHSLYPGSLRLEPLGKLLQKSPRRVIENAVWGMLPKGRLGRQLIRKLKVYAEAKHPHGAQNSELALPTKPGKPAKKPRPVRVVKAAAAAPTPAPAAAKPAVVPKPAVRPAPQKPVAEAPAAPPPAAPKAEAPADTTPLTPPAPKSRSRKTQDETKKEQK
jgi:large subunit ribosomal protein L13